MIYLIGHPKSIQKINWKVYFDENFELIKGEFHTRHEVSLYIFIYGI